MKPVTILKPKHRLPLNTSGLNNVMDNLFSFFDFYFMENVCGWDTYVLYHKSTGSFVGPFCYSPHKDFALYVSCDYSNNEYRNILWHCMRTAFWGGFIINNVFSDMSVKNFIIADTYTGQLMFKRRDNPKRTAKVIIHGYEDYEIREVETPSSLL